MGFLERWRLARHLQRKAAEGCVLIAVPREMAPGVAQAIWERNVQRAAARWTAREGETPLSKWQSVMLARAEKRL